MEYEIKVSKAFEAMKILLERFYTRTHSDVIGSLLGDLSLFPDGMPADEATWYEWLESIKKTGVVQKNTLSHREAFIAMLDFVKEYADRIESKEVWKLLIDMQLLEDGTTVNPIYGRLVTSFGGS